MLTATCTDCNGSGCAPDWTEENQAPCEHCGGKGLLEVQTCEDCRGTGHALVAVGGGDAALGDCAACEGRGEILVQIEEVAA